MSENAEKKRDPIVIDSLSNVIFTVFVYVF